MKVEWIAASLILITPAPAFAGPPRYDVMAYCEWVAQTSGGSAVIKNGCIDMEQSAYNNLKARWNSISSKSRSYCDEVARTVGGSYSILEGCIEMEESAASTTKQFEY